MNYKIKEYKSQVYLTNNGQRRKYKELNTICFRKVIKISFTRKVAQLHRKKRGGGSGAPRAKHDYFPLI